MDEERKDRIGELNDTLYSRTRYKDPLDKRTPVKEVDFPDVEGKWQTPELDEILKYERVAPEIHPLMKKIFIFALLFFVATVGVATFIFTGGANFISSKNVDINVLGPTISQLEKFSNLVLVSQILTMQIWSLLICLSSILKVVVIRIILSNL